MKISTTYPNTENERKKLWVTIDVASFFHTTCKNVVEAYFVSRPANLLLTSYMYLYNNPNPSLLMALYFLFIFPLGCNAGNDYMDWERDMADKNREISVSRGRGRSKNFLWWCYAISTAIAFSIGLYDPLFGAQYFLFIEVGGQLVYNGIFLGIPVHELSISKSVGFPVDLIVAAWTFMPFQYLVGQKSWLPDLMIASWGASIMIYAQLKDYEYEKTGVARTTATFLGPTLCRLFVSITAVALIYADVKFLPYGLYTLYRCIIYPKKGIALGGLGKMSVILWMNTIGVVLFNPAINGRIKWTILVLNAVAHWGCTKFNSIEQK